MDMWTDSARRQYQRSGPRYASDLTDAEFALIEPMLPPAKRGGRRRKTVLREVLNAILYLLRTGCPAAACWPRPLPGIGSMASWPSIGGCCRRSSRRARRSTTISAGRHLT